MAASPMRRIQLDVTDSTNLRARELAALHSGEPLLVSAAEQTAGRGRQGRTWHSPRGGAWLTVVWPLSRGAQDYEGASLAAAVAVRRALCELAPQECRGLEIKWPNDLLLAGGKVAGILCEQAALPGGGEALLVGVGVNVDVDVSRLPSPARHPPTSLAAHGARASVEAVVDAVGQHLAGVLQVVQQQGLGALLGEFRQHMAYVGTVRTWTSPAGQVAGRVVGVDDAGRLLLASADGGGAVQAFASGEFTSATGAGDEP
ncbi:MAG TPA: biotin--[acetyl-CoA-carboxylase] ligase [Lacipirellulaceae bacterium]|nr:biotin--[acetyl-CoA-carboxylase] ligase [Lacipirellulaceae bacterium]